MVDWLAANLRQRTDYDAICRSERGDAGIVADADTAVLISHAICGGALELLHGGIEAGIVDPSMDREAILSRLVEGITDVAVAVLPGLSYASDA